MVNVSYGFHVIPGKQPPGFSVVVKNMNGAIAASGRSVIKIRADRHAKHRQHHTVVDKGRNIFAGVSLQTGEELPHTIIDHVRIFTAKGEQVI